MCPGGAHSKAPYSGSWVAFGFVIPSIDPDYSDLDYSDLDYSDLDYSDSEPMQEECLPRAPK